MNNSYARFCNIIFYYLSVIVCLIGIYGDPDMRKPTKTILFVFFILLGFLPGFLLDSNILDMHKYKRFYLVTYCLASLCMYFTWNSITLFIGMLFLESMLCLVYLDPEFLLFQNFFCIILLTFLFFYERVNDRVTLDEVQFLIIFFMFLGANYIGRQVVKLVLHERFKSMEQERSLDDMLRVVETKVDEARNAVKAKSEFHVKYMHKLAKQ